MKNIIELIQNLPYAKPILIFSASIIIGLIIELLIISKLHKITSRSKWKIDQIITQTLQKFPFIWSILLGAHFASLSIELPGKYLLYTKKTLLILTMITFTQFLAKLITRMIQLYAKKSNQEQASSSIISMISKVTVYLVGLLIILQTAGVAIAPLITTLGIGGLAVALALQDTLSNLFSGIYLIASKQINPGNYIKLDSGEEGYITDIGWRNLTIRELGNNTLVIPNSKIVNTIIRNYDLHMQEMSVLIQVGVSYGSDLEKVEKVTIATAKKTLQEVEGGVQDFDPFIRYHTFDSSSINFTVILRVQEFVNQYLIKHEFIKRLHKNFKKENIEIPFPIRTVYMKPTSDKDNKGA